MRCLWMRSSALASSTERPVLGFTCLMLPAHSAEPATVSKMVRAVMTPSHLHCRKRAPGVMCPVLAAAVSVRVT